MRRTVLTAAIAAALAVALSAEVLDVRARGGGHDLGPTQLASLTSSGPVNPTAAATDQFLKIMTTATTSVAGESVHAAHRGEIDVVSFNWSDVATQSSTGAPKQAFQPLSFEARTNKGTPTLFRAMTAGTVFPSARLSVRRRGSSAGDYLIVDLTEVRVISLVQKSDDRELPLDQLKLDYRRIKVTYRPTNADGTLGTPVSYGWDRVTNTTV